MQLRGKLSTDEELDFSAMAGTATSYSGSLKWRLYTLLAIENFGDRMWMVVSVFLVDTLCSIVASDSSVASLRYVSIFCLVPNLAITFALPLLGSLFSRYQRLGTLISLTVVQNLEIVVNLAYVKETVFFTY